MVLQMPIEVLMKQWDDTLQMKRIKVFGSLDNKWYYGSVKSYDPTNRLYYARYDDCDDHFKMKA